MARWVTELIDLVDHVVHLALGAWIGVLLSRLQRARALIRALNKARWTKDRWEREGLLEKEFKILGVQARPDGEK